MNLRYFISSFAASLLAVSMTLALQRPISCECNCHKDIVIEETVEETEEPIIIEPETEPTPVQQYERVKERLASSGIVVAEPEEEPARFTDSEIDLIALVTMAEAEGEPEEGKRLVIDTILNRVDHNKFPDTINGVIYQKNQFEAMWNGRVDRCHVRDDIRQLVIEEIDSRTNYETIFFTAGGYSKYGTPLFQVQNHYFSKY